MKYQFFLFICMFPIVQLWSQTPEKTLEKIVQSSQNEMGIDTDISCFYKYYLGEKTTPEVEEQSFFQNKDNFSYYKLGDLEMISGNDIMVCLQHNQKVAVIDRQSKLEQYQSPSSLEMLLTQIKSGTFNLDTSSQGSERVLHFYGKDNKKKVYSISYDPESYRILKSIVYYDEEQTDALFGDEYTHSRLEMELFYKKSEKLTLEWNDVVVQNDTNLKLTTRFKNYKVYDLRQN